MSEGTSTADAPPRWALGLNLAQPRLGAQVVYATDDFFAAKERLIQASAPVWREGEYDDNGKWMDGWESRRRRDDGHDHCVVRLGLRAVVDGFEIDTTYFDGNHPEAASIDVADGDEAPPGEDGWREVVPRTPLSASRRHWVKSETPPCRWVRLHIYPDGGVARLRVFGRVLCDWTTRPSDEIVDLAAVENGGRVLWCNDQKFGLPTNLLLPGSGLDMGDGWETRRRRSPGHDWVVLELGRCGHVERVEIDTAHFKGNYPDRVSVQGGLDRDAVLTAANCDASSTAWPEILSPRKLAMDQIHTYESSELTDVGAVSHVRVNIFPDGGLSRVRIFGRPVDDE